MDIKEQVEQIVNTVVADITANVKELATKQVTAEIQRNIAAIDFPYLVQTTVRDRISEIQKEMAFGDSSIPGSAIKSDSLILSGNNVKGGIITNFGSTGIQDDATACRVTILDEATVVENRLVTTGAEIRGDLVIDGNIELHGEVNPDSAFVEDLVSLSAGRVRLSLNDELYSSYANLVFDLISKQGLDLSKITLSGTAVVEGNNLGTTITESNLQKVGELRQLVVVGESLLYNTLYVGNNRVGINTSDPSNALSVWDAEVEIVVKKQKKDTGFIGTVRKQNLAIGTDGNPNIILDTDGGTTINHLKLGSIEVSTSPTAPAHNARKGSIVFNENPTENSPFMWVSLGNSAWKAISG